MEQLLLVSPTVDGVVTITLNRPEKRNALSIALRDEISDALDGLAEDNDVKAVVVTGAGDVFCAGFDLGEFQRMDDPAIGTRLWPSSDRYHRTCLGVDGRAARRPHGRSKPLCRDGGAGTPRRAGAYEGQDPTPRQRDTRRDVGALT